MCLDAFSGWLGGDNVREIKVSRGFEVPKTQMCCRAEENAIQQEKKKKSSPGERTSSEARRLYGSSWENI